MNVLLCRGCFLFWWRLWGFSSNEEVAESENCKGKDFYCVIFRLSVQYDEGSFVKMGGIVSQKSSYAFFQVLQT